MVYATGWNAIKGYKYFYNNGCGLYQKVIGLALNKNIRTTQLPKLEPHMSEEDFKELTRALETNWTGLDHIDKHVYVKMFGYESVHDYYDKCSVAQDIAAIKVPTFGLGSVDDPICGDHAIPFADIEAKDGNVFLASSINGGHACHMTGSFNPQTFVQEPCMMFLNFMEAKLDCDVTTKY